MKFGALLRKQAETLPKIALHIITMDRSKLLERVLYSCWWCFDSIRVCDGGSKDNTLDVCKKFHCEVVINKWNDDMSEQHNKLLELASPGEWIFILDDDEYPSDQLMYRFRELVSDERYNLYKIPSIVEIDGIMQCDVNEIIHKIEHENHSQFSKDILFKFKNGVYYEGSSHYALKGNFWQSLQISEPIIHIKTPEDIIWCDVYQGFINPSTQGYSVADGVLLHDLFSRQRVNNTADLKAYLAKGNIDNDLKQLFIKWKMCDDVRGRWYQYYFLVLHPEELPVGFGIMDEVIVRHLREKGGLRSYTVWDDDDKEYLPIGHLDIPDELRRRIDTNLVPVDATYWTSLDESDIEMNSCDVGNIIEIPLFATKQITTQKELKEMLSSRGEMAGDYEVIYEYACQCKGNIIEVGAHHGASTCIFGAVLKFFNVDGMVYSIDIHKSYYPDRYLTYHGSQNWGTARMSLFLEMLMRTGCEDKVTPLLCSSEEASKFLRVEADLVYVDGNHSYECCYFDLCAWGKRLKAGGVMLVHDYHPEIEGDGVATAVDDFLGSGGWEHVETVGMLTVLKKL